MLNAALVRAMLSFESDLVRGELLRASFNPTSDDRKVWEGLLPDVFRKDGPDFTPVPLAIALDVVEKCDHQWGEHLERRLGIPTLVVRDPEDVNTEENFTLRGIPLTQSFIEGVLEDNKVDSSDGTDILPGFACSIYGQPYVVLAVVLPVEGVHDARLGIEGLLVAPACMVDRNDPSLSGVANA